MVADRSVLVYVNGRGRWVAPGDSDFPAPDGTESITFVEVDGRTVSVGPEGLDVVEGVLSIGGFQVPDAGGNTHLRAHDIDTARYGRGTFETALAAEGAPDDDYLAMFDASGLTRSTRPVLTTATNEASVVAQFNVLRDALILLGVAIDGD